MPFSMCGTVLDVMNTVYCWEGSYVITALFKHTCINTAFIKLFLCSSHLPNMRWKFWFDLERVDDLEGCGFLMLLFWYFYENKNNFVRKSVINAVTLVLPQEASSLWSCLIHWTYRIFTLYRFAGLGMYCAEWKHIWKGLYCIPAFLDSFETEL